MIRTLGFGVFCSLMTALIGHGYVSDSQDREIVLRSRDGNTLRLDGNGITIIDGGSQDSVVIGPRELLTMRGAHMNAGYPAVRLGGEGAASVLHLGGYGPEAPVVKLSALRDKASADIFWPTVSTLLRLRSSLAVTEDKNLTGDAGLWRGSNRDPEGSGFELIWATSNPIPEVRAVSKGGK